jgi:hypothetical protein
VSGSNSFTPYPPSGNITTDINIENEYIIYTSEVGASWMFDWGDGIFSDWIYVTDSDDYIFQAHNWNSYGDYEVRIKQRNIYMTESTWSNPLIVSVAPPTDLDGDGWKNDIEIAYGTNPEDPYNFPFDTDYDGIPDEDSIDGAYLGDNDDDNDGLIDEIETILGSNPKKFGDIVFLVIEKNTYCLVNTNENSKFDLLYNTLTEVKTKTKNEEDVTLLDIDDDGSWDYSYNNGILVVYKESFKIPWLYVIIAIIAIVLIVVSILFKKGIIYLYEDEYIDE